MFDVILEGVKRELFANLYKINTFVNLSKIMQATAHTENFGLLYVWLKKTLYGYVSVYPTNVNGTWIDWMFLREVLKTEKQLKCHKLFLKFGQ